ncbi:MAG: T9SS type A sorting domain-containing protein [Bacteroidetes bacterium]|nr:T9SS type A sorting domain-containing protein [Bacteroidota bacterium]
MSSLFLALLLTFSVQTFAQLDVKHFIPPLFGREDKGCHYLTLSTPQTNAFPVTVTDGSGNFITTLTVSNSASISYSLGCNDTSRFLVTEAELNTALSNEGLILTAQYPFYVNLRVQAGAQAGSLTSKGEKASLGTDFRVGFMYNNNGQSFRKANVFGFMATENNTTVNITEIRPGVIFRGTTPSGTPLTTQNISVTLNAGQCYVVSEFLDEATATQNINGGNGTRITSDKPIAVNVGTWLGGNAIVSGVPSTGRDLGIDQIVPVETVGSEYVLIKGEGVDNEQTIVVATQNNTDLFLNGNATPIATINAGDYYVLDGTGYSAFDNLYLQSSSPVYLYQTTNGSDGTTDDNERQSGLNFLPPVGCSGGKNVVLPDVAFIGQAYINIIANTGANIYVNGTLLGAGDPITGTSSYVTYKLTSGYTGDVNIVSDKLIRVALINLNGNIGASGYFSGFTKDISVQTQTINGDNIALEGCVSASFTSGIDAPTSTPTVLTYTIGGTATNGIDYSHLDNSITIPAGQTQASVIINSISDGVPESQEAIYIIYQPDLCSPLDTAYLYINDADPIEFTLNGTSLTCFDNNTGQITINATGGFQPYTYHVTYPVGQTINYTSSPVTGLEAGTYTVQVYDIYGCKAEALVVGGVFDADTTFLPDGSGVTYTTQIPINGFDAGQTLDNMSQLQQICATMEHSYLGDLSLSIISPSGQVVVLKEQNGGGSCNLGIPFASGAVDGANSNLTDPGTGYEYCWNTSPNYLTMVAESFNFNGTFPSSTGGTYNDTYLPSGSYASFQNLNGLLGSTLNGNWTLQITDQYGLDNGYIFNWNISLVSDLPDTTVQINQPDSISISGFVTQAQCGQNDGAINASVSGVNSPFTYLWSNGATTQDLTGIGAGTYTLHVTDTNGCSDSLSFNLNNISSLSTTATSSLVTCAGGNNGAINITTTGGATPYSFLWSNGATTEDITNLQAGSYTLTVTGANGCIHSKTVVVGTIAPILISLDNSSNEFCGTQNGAINISVSGGSGSYGYSWNNGTTTQDLSSITAGSYTLTVTDGNSCTQNANYSIVNDVSSCSSYCYLNILTNNVTNETCGNDAGAIDVSIMDATQPYNVSWNTGATTEDLSNLQAGNYTITVQDANQCIVNKTITVGNNVGNLALTNTQIINDNCGQGVGAINVTASGGTLPYAYNWSNSTTTEDVTSLNAGTYTLIVTDGNSCSLTQSYVVTNNTGTLNQTAVVTNELCNNNFGAINLTVTGATGTLTYLWSNGATTQDLNNLSSGTFSVLITDANGCTLNSNPYTVNNLPGTLVLNSVVINNENCNNNQGAINITVSGGNIPYTYSWSNGATTEDISSLNAGSYNVTVTDNNGCSVSSNNNVVFDAPGTLNVSTDFITNEVCANANGAIYVSVSGGTTPYTLQWNNGSIAEDNLNLSAGNYILTVTDANGCSFNHAETILNSSGTLNINNTVITNETCNNSNGAIDLVISGGTNPITYAWSNGQTNQDITGLAAGSYSVTATDNNGCEATTNVTITNVTGTLAVIHQGTAELCSNNGGAIDLTVSGGLTPYTYLWNNSATTEDLTGISGGNYSCTITDANNCSILTGTIFIANNPGTLVVNHTAINSSCGLSNGAIDLQVSGGTSGYTYSWSTGATTQDLTNLSAGNYTYTVTDASMCEKVDSVIITNTSGSLSISNVQITNEVCNNNAGAINISITGGTNPLTYTWSNSAITEDLTALNQGIYSCTISDAAGCSVVTGNLTVSNSASTLSLSNITVVDATCGNTSGSINLSVSGGQAPLTYLWSTGATTEDIPSGLSAGNYSCTITDANGCSIQALATVNNTNGTLAIVSNVITNESCGNTNGAVNITVQGGNGAYTYTWSEGSTTQDISNLNSGTYSVTVLDGNGCTTNQAYSVLDIGTNISIAPIITSDEICGNQNGSINISVQGGSSPFSYSWNNGSLFEDQTNLSAGPYSVIVTDANGCITNGNFTINNNTNGLAINSIIATDESCGNGLGAINLSVTGGINPITYSWNNGQTTQDLSNLSAGSYDVVVSDVNGCSVSSSATIQNQTGGLSAIVNTITNENCGDTTGSIDINVNGGTLPYTFAWSNTSSNEDLIAVGAGNYSVTVTDGSGCSVILNGSVSNNSSGFAINNAIVANENCSDSSGFIDINLVGGNTPYTINWSNTSNLEDQYNLTSGSYTVSVTDNLGCTINQAYQINNNSSSGLTATPSIVNETCDGNNGSINVNVSGGIAPITYTWSSGSTSPCCSYTLNMNDTWGDGWNGAILVVSVNGLTVGTYSATGTGSSVSIPVCDNDNIQLTYTAGVFEEENSYTLLNTSGGTVFTNGPNPTVGVAYTGTTSCAIASGGTSQTNLSAGVYSLTITDDVGCSIVQSYTITNTSLYSSSGVVTDASCGTCPNGAINLSVTNGAAPYTYLWSNGLTSQDLINLTPGTYSVTITGASNCVVRDTFIVGSSTSLATISNANWDVKLFPNPATDAVYLSYYFNKEEGVKLDLTNLIGQSIYKQDIADRAGKIKIDTQQLPNGIYFIRLYNNNRSETIKLVISH